MASFSSRGPTSEEGIKPEVAAPGVGICSLQWDSAWDDNKCFDDEHVAISGTSMATPHVAGVAALLVQAHPDWSPEEVKSAVVGTASDLGENVYIQGSGLVDAFKAVNAPVLLDPGVANVKSTTFSFSVKNVESSSLGIEFVAEPVEHVETGTDYPDFIQSFSNNNFCLPAAGSEKVYFQTMSLDTLPGGKYSGFVRVKAYPNCDFSSEPEETVLPVGFLKAKKLTIDLTMSSVSYDDHHIVGIFLRNKENGYYWDEDIFSYDEHLVETINAAEDVFDAYIFVHTSNQGGTRVRDSVIIRGVDLTGVYSKSLVINEVLAPAVETNIRDILNSRGMAPTMIQYV
ncbi:hypothetical protein COT48_02900, partial [Candidatus Woesearchaeota archaeon CG08_land_8_20_14_0_20_47_9]